MSRLRSLAAQELATQLRFVLAREKFIEARMFITYADGELPHVGTLALYCEYSTEDPYNNMFRGDAPDMEFDLGTMGLAQTNKRFIDSLRRALVPHWRYLSKQLRLGWNLQGYADVSARFDIEELKAILPID